MSELNKNKKISFTDLDTFLKIAPMIGLAVLAYLQTLFPSKAEFEVLHLKIGQPENRKTKIKTKKTKRNKTKTQQKRNKTKTK